MEIGLKLTLANCCVDIRVIFLFIHLCVSVYWGWEWGMEVRGEPMKSVFSFYWVPRVELRTSSLVASTFFSESLASLLLGIET